jgi:hypothetical protein
MVFWVNLVLSFDGCLIIIRWSVRACGVVSQQKIMNTLRQDINGIWRRLMTAGCCVLFAVFFSGCGTTKWSDTSRTATEQLLISSAIDHAVHQVDFSPLCNCKCFIKTDAISQATDHDYMAMTIRQQAAAAGAILSAKEDEADFIVEVRSGGVGTDRDEFLVGVPALNMPAIPGTMWSGAVVPEIPFIKRTRQKGVAKVALFAYNRHTGKPVWSSGNHCGDSIAKNIWFGGLGPITKGTLVKEATFAGNPIPVIFDSENRSSDSSWMDAPQMFLENTPLPMPVPHQQGLKPAR